MINPKIYKDNNGYNTNIHPGDSQELPDDFYISSYSCRRKAL
jgi:hypothetical protein